MNILAINPGSTSTKVGVYKNGEIIKENFSHSRDTINSFQRIFDQKDFRYQCIFNFLKERGWDKDAFQAVVGRGGLVKPLAGGVYRVNEPMISDLEKGVSGHHASNLGGILASMFGEKFGCPAYIVDPVVVDEMDEVARYTGLDGTRRKSLFHALNQKAAARKISERIGKAYDALNLIVAHLGGGISVGAHKKGRVVDVNNALSGDGPFSPERAGGLPVEGVLSMITEKGCTPDQLMTAISRQGGVYSYLGIVDMAELSKMYEAGDEKGKIVLEAMVYQIVKEIGALAAVLEGDVDGIILTGGIAHSALITGLIREKVAFLSNVYIEPGEYEIEALISGVRRVHEGGEKVKEYI